MEKDAVQEYRRRAGEVEKLAETAISEEHRQIMLRIAEHMADTKVLRTRASSWKDFFFPEAQDQNGN